jgi:glycosyltransferase involved in cell wall biosynthesis
MSANKKPTLLLISQTLRRDLEDPLRYFKHLRIVHCYTDAGYGDMRPEDFASQPVKYTTPQDLERILWKIRPDIIQAQEPYASRLAMKNAWVVSRYAKATHTPFFFPVFENRPPTQKYGWLRGWLVQHVVGWFGRQATGVITLNDGARRNLLAAGIPSRKLQRLNWGTWGIDLQEFKPNKSQRSKRPLVFFVGRVSAAKGVPDILAAWPTILAAVPNAQLVVAGPGADDSLLKQIKQSPATRSLGPIKNAELPTYFQQAWVTVAPSVTTPTWEEQVGMINLQSLACETPVVTTESGAIPEYVVDAQGASLVPERDSAAIASAVIKLLTDSSLRSQQGTLGRSHVANHYEVQANIAIDEAYVLKLLGELP